MSSKCTEFCMVDDPPEPHQTPCQCPKCKGWIKWIYNEETKEFEPICNKCHTPLIVIPDQDEDTGEDLESGRICIVTCKCKKEGEKKDEPASNKKT